MTNQQIFIIIGRGNRPILIDVTYKKNKKGKRVVVFSHGFKGFKDWGAFNQIAETFAENNFVFVKFNFSHNGTTSSDPIEFVDLKAFGNNNFCKELDDLGFVLDWVEENFNPKEISLFGHSRGGGISMLKTAEENRISKVVSWASPSDFTNKMPKERIALWEEKGVAFVYNGRTKQNMPMYFQFYENCIANKDRIDIKKAVEGIKIPQLIIHGSEDPTVKLREAKNLQKWNPDSQLHIIKGADHVLGAFHPYDLEKYPPTLQEAIDVTIDFLKK
ncbi:MAG: alpha/beta hydrolase [Flavobacteriales bacterium]|jgi:pimeloyl-ACP methyl ester carboxylesterase|nr:alpha/beta hydrolase [Flavobacteriales bacterium]MDP7430328.1 alpha/beta hydrolase [Flavobacteriales bacterium]HJN63171.1 alpha/beta hydrolase [Flavobacteriales bacterium]|tara:strand:- start:7561 stop:8382 length:822 start_codon:yes stop_codon:yes gene_type:complete